MEQRRKERQRQILAAEGRRGFLIGSSVLFRALCGLTMAFLASWRLASPAMSQTRMPDFSHDLNTDLALQGRVMWVDGTANIDRITNLDGIRDLVAHCKKANFNTIVLDVKPVIGEVLYNSKIAPHLTEWRGKRYPDFDALGVLLDEAHRNGLQVAASFNVFSEGHKYFGTGLAYRKRDWQSVAYSVERELVADDGARLPVRGVSDPDEPGKTVVRGDDYVMESSAVAGASLAVALESDGHVAGVLDPGLLRDEPVAAPEDGHLIVLSGAASSWATQHLHAGGRTQFIARGLRVPVTESPTEKVAAFVNPLNAEARSYELSLLQEVARSYPVDGIVFDRMRYANLYNDVSDVSRAAFERWLGKPVERWPEEILRFSPAPDEPLQRGRLFKPWLEFRASVIRDFVREATESLRAIRPSLRFGVYVGSWFSDYFGVGVNWGSDKFPVRYSWAAPQYNQTGYAEFLDWLATGCYYPIPTREEARQKGGEEGNTVEAAADVSVAAVQNAAPVYAGVYVLDYDKRPEDFARALATAAKHSDGVMVFDVSYVYEYGWWPILEQAFAQPAAPPHMYPDLIAGNRAAQDQSR